MTNLDTVPILEDRWGAQVLGGARISGWGTGSLFSVVFRNGLEILEGLALGEDAELEFIACHVEECVFRAEDLAEKGVIKLGKPCPGDAYKGELHWEKRDGDLHIPGEGTRRRGWGWERCRRTAVYVPLPGRAKLGIFRLHTKRCAVIASSRDR